MKMESIDNAAKTGTKIKIIACSHPEIWYKDYIGETFNVLTEDQKGAGWEGFWIVEHKDFGGYVDYDDAVVVEKSAEILAPGEMYLRDLIRKTDAILVVYCDNSTHEIMYQVTWEDIEFESNSLDGILEAMYHINHLMEWKA